MILSQFSQHSLQLYFHFLSVLEEAPEAKIKISFKVSLVTRRYFSGVVIEIKGSLSFNEDQILGGDDAMRRGWNTFGSSM